MNAGIDINILNEYGKNALFFCNHVDAVKAMIEAGIEVNHTDNYGGNALFWNQNVQVVKCLIHSGINVHHKNKTGQSCLHQQRNIECAEILVNAGADIHCVDNKGQTVLYNLYFPDIFDYWIDKGCNINHRDYNGKSVLDLSSEYGVSGYDFNVNALMRHIDKIDSTPVLIRHVTYHSLNLINLLYQRGLNVMLAEHCTLSLCVKDMKSIFTELKQHIEIKHTHFYNCRKKHIGIYTGIERVKWFIRNGIRMDDDILRQRSDSDKILDYIARREKKDLLKEMKPGIPPAPVRKRL
ncbi:ankyrin repeat domain-containing protein [Salmonella enterica]|nr:ankyrin repeat domain-containing protein [Salmonella enterica]ECC5022495.1 ankyrin repeat domain-containing protein [Salmonella enterica]ECQ8410090.1 ankyrin repeat domain-containing protein [Salmonella enterica]ECZ7685441.1 ankyrin repeat domain-containing protein [Salmonella enterica]